MIKAIAPDVTSGAMAFFGYGSGRVWMLPRRAWGEYL